MIKILIGSTGELTEYGFDTKEEARKTIATWKKQDRKMYGKAGVYKVVEEK